MAIALTTEAGLTCRPEVVPAAVLEVSEAPDAVREPAVLRPDQQTTIQVLDGVVYVVAGDEDWALTPGDAATIDAGTAYRRWNAGEDKARWLEVYCPA
jgi:mannose-6-phosphate isomerase-like protein (cupin superfamily)